MGYFYQAASGVLLACILCLALEKQGKDFSYLLSLALCCMVLLLSVGYLEPVLIFLQRLKDLGNLDTEMFSILFKVVGISLLSDVASMICSDSGYASMGKSLRILSTAVILWLSIPVFNALLDLIQEILGEI